jgi:hypothetical protein
MTPRQSKLLSYGQEESKPRWDLAPGRGGRMDLEQSMED